MPDARPIPQRRCVACGRRARKGELVRIVRSLEGGVEVDPRGKGPGRGAYVCREGACWEVGLARGRVEATLQVRLSGEEREALGAALAGLLAES